MFLEVKKVILMKIALINMKLELAWIIFIPPIMMMIKKNKMMMTKMIMMILKSIIHLKIKKHLKMNLFLKLKNLKFIFKKKSKKMTNIKAQFFGNMKSNILWKKSVPSFNEKFKKSFHIS
jgi:hypothetical protein